MEYQPSDITWSHDVKNPFSPQMTAQAAPKIPNKTVQSKIKDFAKENPKSKGNKRDIKNTQKGKETAPAQDWQNLASVRMNIYLI